MRWGLSNIKTVIEVALSRPFLFYDGFEFLKERAMSYEDRYREMLETILSKGKWVNNKRTGTRCLTIPNWVTEMELTPEGAPLLQARPSYPVSAVAEVLGYLRQYDNAQQFADIGSKTWFVNANETKDWLDNPNRKGENDLGKIYGGVLSKCDIFSVLMGVKESEDDRGLLLNFWNPDFFYQGCLRPCMNQHQWSIIGDVVNITSTQRSLDTFAAANFNHLQTWFLGMMGAGLAKKEGGVALHVASHVHIYEQHLPMVEEYLLRKPELLEGARIELNDDLMNPIDIHNSDSHAREFINVVNYKGRTQPQIKFDIVA
jgi:thymidylate synthase